jgi:hypothetical protein
MKTIPTHINKINPGDLVFHNGQVRTVSKSNIKNDSFMGKTIFGDSYHLGYKPVMKVELI